jgi:holo-[acyl-carrier protein] synthase
MIKGVGIDLCEIGRFERLKADKKFLRKIFSESELEYCFNRSEGTAASLAARWAAKESLIKALALSRVRFSLKNIAVHINDGGRPEWIIKDDARQILTNQGIMHAHVSLSHDKGVAVAVTILE